MMELPTGKRPALKPLFREYQWNYLVDAVLENTVASSAYVDDIQEPRVAVLEFSKIHLIIPGGDASHPEARAFLEDVTGFAALIPASSEWDTLIKEVLVGRYTALPRYAFTSEKLDAERLASLSQKTPPGYRMAPMDLELSRQLADEKSDFSSGHLLLYESPQDFVARGFGFCILEGGEIVSVATTFVTCEAGIEIQINTRDTHQRLGLATAVSARLLHYCLSLGLDPNWDADNEISAGLAEKLGYSPQGTYDMYLIPGK